MVPCIIIPTKLGLYPAWEPVKFTDNTYRTEVDVIQGHDGSIVKAYGDYRDNLILELEKRIHNNIKISYDTSVFDLDEYIEGDSRETDTPKTAIDKGMLKDFIEWTKVADTQYTKNNFVRSIVLHLITNHAKSQLERNFLDIGVTVYMMAYDTDRPYFIALGNAWFYS